MKRLIYLALAFIAILLLYIFLIIPGTVRNAETATPKVPEPVVTRLFALKKGWSRWWPDRKGIAPRDSTLFSYKGIQFRMESNTFTRLTVMITDDGLRVPSVINLVPGRNAGTEITWSFAYPTGRNPFSRFIRYQKSRKLAAVTGELLSHFKDFVEEEKNVYGVGIEYARVRDSLVLVMRSVSPKYPATAEVYGKVDRLQDFIRKNGIGKNGYPMLNVTRRDDSLYRVMVAIPVRRRAPLPADMEYSRLVMGNILTAEVRGGRQSIDRALNQVRKFIEDRQHTSPAVPFQMMITDRSQVTDSSRWITRIYYPIL